jgi:N-acetylglutamate synthase-like GNAT family acetyltransferase
VPRLYIDEYTRVLGGKTVCTACREGVLRDHFEEVVADIKFLNRQGMQTILYHNVANRFSNRKMFRTLVERLPETRIVRVSPDVDFYEYVLDQEENVHKLIFLERKPLLDLDGRKINAIHTKAVDTTVQTWGDLIANVNYRGILSRICDQIEAGRYDRVHILPAAKNAIKHELFTIEGFGTLIANNFVERFEPLASEEDVRFIKGILMLYKREGFLKLRDKGYLKRERHNFYVTLIDDIVVGCVEKKVIDERTIEIAALAISTRFRNQRVGVFTVKAFIETMQQQGYSRFISLTNNPKLTNLYRTLGFEPCSRPEYQARQAASPDVQMHCIQLPPAVSDARRR